MSEILTLEEVAERLSISRRSAYRLTKLRSLPVIKIGRLIRVKEKDLEIYLERLKRDGSKTEGEL